MKLILWNAAFTQHFSIWVSNKCHLHLHHIVDCLFPTPSSTVTMTTNTFFVLFHCFFILPTPLVATPSRFQSPKHCVAHCFHCFGFRYGFLMVSNGFLISYSVFELFECIFDARFSYITPPIDMHSHLQLLKQCVAHRFCSRYGFYHLLFFFWCILTCFQCIFDYIIHLVAICPRFWLLKQCVACYFCSRYGFYQFTYIIFWHILTRFDAFLVI